MCSAANIAIQYNAGTQSFSNNVMLNTGESQILFTTANMLITIDVISFSVAYQTGCEYQDFKWRIKITEFPPFPDESISVVGQRILGNPITIKQSVDTAFATPCQSVLGAASVNIVEDFSMADYNTYDPSHPIQAVAGYVAHPDSGLNYVSTCIEYILQADIQGSCLEPEIEWSTDETTDQIVVGQQLDSQEITLNLSCGSCEYTDSITIPGV